MRSDRPPIELFLSPAGTPGPALPGGLSASALVEAPQADAAKDRGAGPEHFVDPGGDPNSLRDQGWGVIAPRGDDGDRLLARVRPLLDQRAADQDAEVPVYRVAPFNHTSAPGGVSSLVRKLALGLPGGLMRAWM